MLFRLTSRRALHISRTSTQRLAIGLSLFCISLIFIFHIFSSTSSSSSSSSSSSLLSWSSTPSLTTTQHMLMKNIPDIRQSDLLPPLSRQTLGRSMWSMLHTMAALYPEQPTPKQQQAAQQFISALPHIYPCALCARHFDKYLSTHPLQTFSRSALSNWLCIAHNDVNRRLEKPLFDCSLLPEAWPPELGNSCGCAVEEDDESSTAADGNIGKPTTLADKAVAAT